MTENMGISLFSIQKAEWSKLEYRKEREVSGSKESRARCEMKVT